MNKSIFSVVGVVAVMCVGYAFGQSPAVTTFTDSRDNKVYKMVKIDKQTWMAENLNYAAEGSMCYGNSAKNCAKYGRLYNWPTAMNGASSSLSSPSGVQGVCPAGWHLPSHEEWTTLERTVGSSVTAGTKLKSAVGWNNNGNGTNNYGFSALPGGRGANGSFYDAGDIGLWWSATEDFDVADSAWIRGLPDNSKYVYKNKYGKTSLFSVRCVQD